MKTKAWAVLVLLCGSVTMLAAAQIFTHDQLEEAQEIARRTGRPLAWIETYDGNGHGYAAHLQELQRMQSVNAYCVPVTIPTRADDGPAKTLFNKGVASVPGEADNHLPRMFIADLDGQGLVAISTHDGRSVREREKEVMERLQEWGGVPSTRDVKRFWKSLRRAQKELEDDDLQRAADRLEDAREVVARFPHTTLADYLTDTAATVDVAAQAAWREVLAAHGDDAEALDKAKRAFRRDWPGTGVPEESE